MQYGFGVEFILVDGAVRSVYKEGVDTGASAYVACYPDLGG